MNSLNKLVEWLTDQQVWKPTSSICMSDAAILVLSKMVDLNMIEGRHHPSTNSRHPSVFLVNEELYGRTDNITPEFFETNLYDLRGKQILMYIDGKVCADFVETITRTGDQHYLFFAGKRFNILTRVKKDNQGIYYATNKI